MTGSEQTSLAQKIDFLFTSTTQTTVEVVPSDTPLAQITQTDINDILAIGKNAPMIIEFDDVVDADNYNTVYKCASLLKTAVDDESILGSNEVSILNKLICKMDTILSSQVPITDTNNVLLSQVSTLKTRNSNIDGKISKKHTLTMIMFVFLILQIILTLIMYFYDNQYANIALVSISLLTFISILSSIVYDIFKRIESFDTGASAETCAIIITDTTTRRNAYMQTLSRIENILRKVMANKNFVDEMRIHTNRSFLLMKSYQLKDYNLRRLAFQRNRIRYAYLLVSLIGILFYIRNGNIIDTQLLSLLIGGLVIAYLFYYALQSKQNKNRSFYNWEQINWGQYNEDQQTS